MQICHAFTLRHSLCWLNMLTRRRSSRTAGHVGWHQRPPAWLLAPACADRGRACVKSVISDCGRPKDTASSKHLRSLCPGLHHSGKFSACIIVPASQRLEGACLAPLQSCAVLGGPHAHSALQGITQQQSRHQCGQRQQRWWCSGFTGQLGAPIQHLCASILRLDAAGSMRCNARSAGITRAQRLAQPASTIRPHNCSLWVLSGCPGRPVGKVPGQQLAAVACCTDEQPCDGTSCQGRYRR